MAIDCKRVDNTHPDTLARPLSPSPRYIDCFEYQGRVIQQSVIAKSHFALAVTANTVVAACHAHCVQIVLSTRKTSSHTYDFKLTTQVLNVTSHLKNISMLVQMIKICAPQHILLQISIVLQGWCYQYSHRRCMHMHTSTRTN